MENKQYMSGRGYWFGARHHVIGVFRASQMGSKFGLGATKRYDILGLTILYWAQS